MKRDRWRRERHLLEMVVHPETTESELPAQLGPYRILEVIGQGGEGVVYRAMQEGVERDVALKVILDAPLASPAALEHFLRERDALAKSDHPNILTLFDLGHDQGYAYLSMPWIPKGNLAQNLDDISSFRSGENRRRRWVRLASWLEQVARGLHHAHQSGYLHLDLKPANILIHPDGRPLIADFGMSAFLQEGLFSTGGTPQWMAPEQKAGERVNASTDVYAFGLIMRGLLGDTGCPELEAIMLRCLKHDPEFRYPSAQHLAEDLRAFQEHRPLSAYPGTFFYRLGLWKARNRNTARLLLLLYLSLLVAAAAALRAQHDRKILHETEREARVLLIDSRMREADQAAWRGDYGEAADLRSRGLREMPEDHPRAERYRVFDTAWRQRAPLYIPFERGDYVVAVQSADHRVAIFADQRPELTLLRFEEDQPVLTSLELPAIPLDALFHPEKDQLWVQTSDSLLLIETDTARIAKTYPATLSELDVGVIRWQSGPRLCWSPSGKDLLRIHQRIERIDPDSGQVRSVQNVPKDVRVRRRWILEVSTQGKILLADFRGQGILMLEEEVVHELPLDRITAAAFSEDGTLLALGNLEGQVQVYDTRTAELRYENRHSAAVTDLSFEPGSRLLLSSSRNRETNLHDPEASPPSAPASVEHPAAVTHLQYLPSGHVIISCEDQKLYVLHPYRLKAVASLPGGWAQGCRIRVVHSETRSWLMLDETEDALRLHQLPEYEVHAEPHGQVVDWAMLKDQEVALVNYPEPGILWTRSGQKQWIPVSKPLTSLWSCSLDPYQGSAAFGHADGSATFWHPEGGVRPLMLTEGVEIIQLSYHHETGHLVFYSADGYLHFRDLHGKHLSEKFKLPHHVTRMQLDPTGQRVALSNRLGDLEVWDVIRRTRIRRVERAHANTVLELHFSPSGTFLASGGMDMTARVWSFPSLRPFTPPLPHRDYVWELVFHPEETVLYSAGQEHVYRSWDMATGFLAAPPVPSRGYVNALDASRAPEWIQSATSGQEIMNVRSPHPISLETE